MLSFRLSDDALARPWQTEDRRWQCGECFIEPFDHISLEYFAFAQGSQMTFVVRERLNGYSAPLKPQFPQIVDIDSKQAVQIMAEMEEWPLHFMIIRLCTEQAHLKVSVTNGAWATAPVFFTVSAGCLVGHWDVAVLYPWLKNATPDEIRLAHFLAAFETPYSAKTIFPGLYMLTERACAVWEGKSSDHVFIRITYPPATPSPGKRMLKPGADVLSMFEKIMSQSVNRWLLPQAHIAAELSSGLDSGVVSAVCSGISSTPVHTYGIIVPGEDGVLQQARRAEMVERFGYIDHHVAAADYPLLTADSVRIRNECIIPWEECYYEPMDQLLLMGIEPGKTVMFTGVGGDELFFPHWDEIGPRERAERLKEIAREDLKVPPFVKKEVVDTYLNSRTHIDRAPRSLVPTSSKEAAAYGGARYLRRGVWPVDPFCTPEVVSFCRSLPENWRNKRVLERKFLAMKGCSEKVTHPQSTESFSPFMQQTLRAESKDAILKAMQHSMLDKAGYISSGLFLETYNEFCNGKEMSDAVVFFYAIAIMEMTLQCVERKIAASKLKTG